MVSENDHTTAQLSPVVSNERAVHRFIRKLRQYVTAEQNLKHGHRTSSVSLFSWSGISIQNI